MMRQKRHRKTFLIVQITEGGKIFLNSSHTNWFKNRGKGNSERRKSRIRASSPCGTLEKESKAATLFFICRMIRM